jgi:acid phosphatase type 7
MSSSAVHRVRGRLPVGLLAACAAALAAASATTPAAHAAFPGRNGVIAYEANSSTRGVFYARTTAGGALRRIITGGPSRDPAFSPQGRRLAFARNGAVWSMYVDGFGLQKLTARRVRATEPAWSPRGDALVFTGGAAGNRHLYTVEADGTTLRQLTFEGRADGSPAWSVRDQIAFVRATRHSGTDIYVTTPAGAGAQRLTRHRANDEAPAWSPDGGRIVFVRGRGSRRDLWLMNADGTGLRRLTHLRRAVASPAWSPDGRRIAFAIGTSDRRQIYVVGADGRALRRLTSGDSDPRVPDWQPTGADPVVAAAGDIACDPADAFFDEGRGRLRRCHQRQTSDLLLRADLAGILVLGDAQYERGRLDAFQRSFGPTWGRLKALMHPVPGNHEYRDPGAAGYFDYFNGPGQQIGLAGSRDSGWYSFDVGTWHVVALNSECSEPRSNPTEAACAAGSPQEQWLRADLAAHPAACTLAFWHHPLFASAEGASPTMRPIWQALYDAGVDVVLNGHVHAYERFAPQTPDGARDDARGIREFVVGTGGKSRQAFFAFLPTSEVHDRSAFGILELTLAAGRYSWTFVPEAGRAFTDSGTAPCH